MTGLLQALTFYLFPMLIGRTLTRALYRKELPLPFVSYFITGALLTYAVIALGLFINSAFFNLPGILVIQVLTGIMAVALLPMNLFLKRSDLNIKPYILPFVFSVILALSAYSIWQFKSPYPFNWDLFEHQTLVNTILSGKFNVIPSAISDTFGFDGYSTIFHTLIAASQAFFSADFLNFWLFTGAVHLVLIIFASYLLAAEVTGNKNVAYLSALITAFVFDSNISFTTLFLIPQTITAVIFIFLFIQMLKMERTKLEGGIIFIIGNSLFILINHYIIGSAAVLIYLGSYLYLRFHDLLHRTLPVRRIIEAAIFLGFAGVIFSSYVSLGSINYGEASYYTQSIADKFSMIRQFYGLLFALLIPIGVYVALVRGMKKGILTLIIFLSLIFLISAQLPYVAKFYTLGKFFADMLIAVGIYAIIKPMVLPFRYISYALLAAALVVIFVLNVYIWKGILHYQDMATNVSKNEILASNFLAKKYKNKDVLLISDPATQNILEAASKVNSAGGAYMNHNNRELLSAINQNISPVAVSSKLYSINDKIAPTKGIRVLVLSGRYFMWQNSENTRKQSFYYNIWEPADLTLENISKINALLASSSKFKLVYSNPTVAVVEVYK